MLFGSMDEDLGYDRMILRLLRESEESGISIDKYLREGYDSDQISAITDALRNNIDIDPYLDISYRGACISEIAAGLSDGIDVSVYNSPAYTWRKMREVRLGMKENLNVSGYNDPAYSYWQMHEIRLGLKEGIDVSKYADLMYTAKEMRKRRLMMLAGQNCSKAREWNFVLEDDFDICISPDGLKAYFNWRGKTAIKGPEEIIEILRGKGIIYGIHNEMADELAEKYKVEHDSEESLVLIAEGREPSHGRDGYYEWKFNARRNRFPGVGEDGSIMFNEFRWFEPVKKGQTVAVYHFAKTPVDGITVTGNAIEAKPGMERPALKGCGFRVMSDLCTYKASVGGHAYLKNNELMIEKLYELDDIDAGTETVRYGGDVHIRGDVEGPVEIIVGGDLVIDGFVKNAKIHCGGSLLLKSGINNSSELEQIRVMGSVISRVFEYVNIHSDGSIYFGSSLNSNLCAYGEIVSYGRFGGIVGGNSYAEKGFCLENIGNDAGVQTILRLGCNSSISNVKSAFEKKTFELRKTISKLAEVCQKFGRNVLVEKADRGTTITKIENTIRAKNNELDFYEGKMEKINKRSDRAFKSEIVVNGKIYDNVQVRYKGKRFYITRSLHVDIRVKDDSIKIIRIQNMEKEEC